MFAGIVDHCGEITQVETKDESCRFTIATQFADLQLGESISVDGVCLTVTEIHDNQFCCDVSSETLKVTIARNYKVGNQVNLERALRMQDRVGGHFVSGHCDEPLLVAAIHEHEDFCEFIIAGVTDEQQNFIVKKGSIAINGVSLTVNQVIEGGFQVMVIPHTLQTTNLDALKVGALVNIEYDQLAKLVEKQVTHILMRQYEE